MVNGSTIGHRDQSKAFNHEISLRQATEGKRKESLDIFKWKKGLTVLPCSLENHSVNRANRIDQLRMDSFYSLNHVNNQH